MSRRLLSMDSGGTGFSPFIDVAVNGMAAMFIFLVIYVALVRPRPIPPLVVLTQSLPRGAWAKSYEAAMVVTGGQAPYRFRIIGQPQQELAAVGLSFDTHTGRIAGTPMLPKAKEMTTGREIALTVEVSDQSGRKAENPQPLRLEITSMSVPFDPEKDRLRFAANELALPHAVVGRPYRAAIPILGGLEPYELSAGNEGTLAPSSQVSQLPPGLHIERATGCIEGTPQEDAVPENEVFREYHVAIRVVDQQSAKLPETDRRPTLKGDFVLRVDRVTLMSMIGPFPPSGRAGLEYRGAVTATGGYGKYHWSAATPGTDETGRKETSLTQLGLAVNATTGVIQGRIPSHLASDNRPLLVTIPLMLDDDDATSDPVKQDFDLLLLPPMQFLRPE